MHGSLLLTTVSDAPINFVSLLAFQDLLLDGFITSDFISADDVSEPFLTALMPR